MPQHVPSDARIKWAAIAGMALAVAAPTLALRLPWAWQELLVWLALFAAFAVGARLFRRRGSENVVLCLTALMQVCAFGAAYIALMSLAARTDRPLIDAALVRIDGWLGLRVPDVIEWSRRHPVLDALLAASYHTVQAQTLLVILFQGLNGERWPLETCLMRLMIAVLLTLALFAAFPAAGPFTPHGYGLPPSPSQQTYLDAFYGYRSGQLRTVIFYNREGLITFPSFHTAWAVILAAAWTHRPRLLAVFAPLNAAVVVSTVTTGWHYVADVLAGLAVALLAIGLTHAARKAALPAVRASL